MYSPNMLKTFKTCPKKYYYRYVYELTPPIKTLTFEKGKNIHALANYYLKGEDISKLEKILTEEENNLWTTLKSNVYFQKKCLYTEYNISCKIDKYWFGGRLDALMQENDNYFILDYKTGNIPQNPEYDFQTMIYLLAVDKLIKDYNELNFIYIDLKNNKNYKIQLTNKLKETYKNNLIKICDSIKENYDENRENCKFCEYKKMC